MSASKEKRWKSVGYGSADAMFPTTEYILEQKAGEKWTYPLRVREVHTCPEEGEEVSSTQKKRLKKSQGVSLGRDGHSGKVGQALTKCT